MLNTSFNLDYRENNLCFKKNHSTEAALLSAKYYRRCKRLRAPGGGRGGGGGVEWWLHSKRARVPMLGSYAGLPNAGNLQARADHLARLKKISI